MEGTQETGVALVSDDTKALIRSSLAENTIRNHKAILNGFQWGYSGSGPAQLAAAILYEITDDVELSQGYYELFKHDHVSQWDDTFEISEFEVRIWLSLVGAEIELPRLDLIQSEQIPDKD